jgi:DMSO/TMAO reductase YedYZ molybdopterin-dependent catalytic subunit
LHIDHACDGEVMIPYEMNGAPLPMLNGFPLRLVVPGWYATYWVQALSSSTVLQEPLKSSWMDKAYRIPDTPNANEDPTASCAYHRSHQSHASRACAFPMSVCQKCCSRWGCGVKKNRFTRPSRTAPKPGGGKRGVKK